jgi:hypothetical protein
MDPGDDVTGSKTRTRVYVKGALSHMWRKRWENNLLSFDAYDEKGKEQV